MNAAIFVCDCFALGFQIVGFVGRVARKLAVAAAYAAMLFLMGCCVGIMAVGGVIPFALPIALVVLSVVMIVRAWFAVTADDRPAVIEIPTPAAPLALPVIGTAEAPEEILDKACEYPIVDRFEMPAPVAPVVPSEAPARKAGRKPARKAKSAPAIVEDLDTMPKDALIVLASKEGVKGVSARWGTAALARKIREARALAS